MARAQPIVFAIVASAALCMPARADDDEAVWGSIARDRLFPVQALLAVGRPDDARRSAEKLLERPQDSTAAERMWLNIYRGCAFDRAHQRGAAVEAFRAALAIHDHSMARLGVKQALPTLKHLERLASELGKDRLEHGEVEVGGDTIHWIAMVPPGDHHTALIRVGHPDDVYGRSWVLASMRRVDGVPRDAILVSTDVLPVVAHFRPLLVDDPDLIARVPSRFIAVVDAVERTLPIDPSRVFLTGFSADAVWAWILGLETPDRYAGVIALSACSYPAAIQGRLDRGKRLPVCVLRGELDHQFPARLDQEKTTAAEMIRINPKSQWHLLPGTTHTGVWEHAGLCFHALLDP